MLSYFFGICALVPPFSVFAKPIGIKLANVKKLKKVGASVILQLKGKKVLFIRKSKTTIRVFNPICTHEKCIVAYNDKKKLIECPCHKSAYSLDGSVLDGPAPKPLERYAAKLTDTMIIVKLP